jgi:Tol biopolymer transport system component
MRTLYALLLLTLVLSATSCKQKTAFSSPGSGHSEKLICHLDAVISDGRPVLSPDGRRMAHVVNVGKGQAVVVDGKQEKEYDAILRVPPLSPDDRKEYSLLFSPDGRRVAYAAKVGRKWVVVVDGKEGKAYDEIGGRSIVIRPAGDGQVAFGPIFSPDSRRVAYEARVGSKWTVVADDGEGKSYDGIGEWSLVFSPDSRRVSYAAMVGGKQFAVVDGNEDTLYDHVGAPTFSPNSRRVAYEAELGAKAFVVVDGKRGGSYDVVNPPTFSPDSRCVAYPALVAGKGALPAAMAGGKQFVVVGDKQEGPYGVEGDAYSITPISPIFSPDSGHVAYAAIVGEKWAAVVDGKAQKSYDEIRGLVFSADSRRVAYRARVGDQWVVVVDDKEQRPYDRVGEGPVFSLDGLRMAYVAVAIKGLPAQQFAVVDGREEKPYHAVVAVSVAADKGKAAWTINDSITDLTFSPDGRRVAYVVIGGGKAVVVAGGKEGKPYDALVEGARVVFDSPSSLHYLALKQTAKASKTYDVYLVEETLY